MDAIKSIPAGLAGIAHTLGVDVERLWYLDGFFQKLIEQKKHAFIAFHASRRGEVIFSGNYGTQSPDGAPLRDDAIFCVASVTKPFVAACCAIAQEDGLIDFWDKVQTYFPEFEGEGKDGVCLWHLLCHTSGVSEEQADAYANKYVDDYLENAGITDESDEDAKNDVYMNLRKELGLPDVAEKWQATDGLWFGAEMKAPLVATPGTAYSYYNNGYAMLAKVIEQVSGMTLEEYMTRKIFEPLGMTDSHFTLPDDKRPRYVLRDPVYKGGQWFNSDYVLISTSAAGGLKTTMPDLLRFGEMFRGNGTAFGKRVLSPASIRLMTHDHNATLPDTYWRGRQMGSNWGFGWDVKNGKKDDLGMLRSDRSYNHCGFGGARIHVDPDAEVVVALYMVEQYEDDFCPNMSNAVNILYSSLD